MTNQIDYKHLEQFMIVTTTLLYKVFNAWAYEVKTF